MMKLKINTIMANFIKSSIGLVWDKIIKVVDNKIIRVSFPKCKCSTCTVMDAKWKNIHSLKYACNDCVPRDCSCRLYKKSKRAAFLIKQYDYEKDKNGRCLPCEDWIKI